MKILKKAQIEVSFNWIYVLIAGGAILLVFIIIAKNYMSETTTETSTVISERIQKLLSAIQQNPEGVQTQENLKVQLEFECKEDGHTYMLEGSTKKAYLNSEIIFTPRKIGDSKTIAWTQLYSSPYPVVQVLYFSDEKTQYIFEESAREYYLKFPEQFERQILSQNEIELLEDEGFRKYIIITRSVVLALDSSMKKKSTIVRIGENKVEFIYNGDYSDGVSVPYVNDATMYGAIISGDDELYGCTMEKLMQFSRIVGEMNLERTKMLAQTENTDCKLFFTSSLPQGYIQDTISYSVYSPSEDYASLRESMTNLYKINRDMSRFNCPTIY